MVEEHGILGRGIRDSTSLGSTLKYQIMPKNSFRNPKPQNAPPYQPVENLPPVEMHVTLLWPCVRGFSTRFTR